MSTDMNLILYCLMFYYFLQVVIDQIVFFYPSTKFVAGKIEYISFSFQKRLSLFLRLINITILPFSAYLLESGQLKGLAVSVSFFMVCNSLLALVIVAVYFQVVYGGGAKQGVRPLLKLASLTYSFHFLGLPLSICLASQYPDYRATILQLAGLFNAFSTFCQIWFVDRALNEIMDRGTSQQMTTTLASVLQFRIIGKIAACIMFWLVFVSIA